MSSIRTGRPGALPTTAVAVLPWLLVPSLVEAQVAEVPGPLPEAARQLAGCYRVELGEWQNPDRDLAYYRTASRIRLDTVPWEGRRGVVPDVWSLRPLQGVRPGETANWSLLAGGDSVRLSWSTGFTGARVQAAVEEERLVGRLTGFTDNIVVGEPDPTRSFVATPISCEGVGGEPVAPDRTVEDIWGETPPLPSCYVPLAVPDEELVEGLQPWAPRLLALDTIVLEPPSREGRQSGMRPTLDGLRGYWRGTGGEDPRLSLGWSDYFTSVTLRAGLLGDTLVGEGMVSTFRPDVPTGIPTSADDRELRPISFRALRVDCGAGAPDRLPGRPVEATEAARRFAGCYAVRPLREPARALEPRLEALLAQLDVFELRTEVAREEGRPPVLTLYALHPPLVQADEARRNPSSWAVSADGQRLALNWGLSDRIRVHARPEGRALVGTLEASVRPAVRGQPEEGAPARETTLDFRADPVACVR